MYGHEPCGCGYCQMFAVRQRAVLAATPTVEERSALDEVLALLESKTPTLPGHQDAVAVYGLANEERFDASAYDVVEHDAAWDGVCSGPGCAPSSCRSASMESV